MAMRARRARRSDVRAGTARPRWRCAAAAGLLFVAALGAAAAEFSAEAARGARLVRERNCLVCHRLGGEGAPVGPALDQVMLRRSEVWLRRWLADPPAMRPGTLMPQYDWREGDLRTLLAYLRTFRTPVDGAVIVARAGTPAEAGRQLVEAYDCGACHKVAGAPGRPVYPDLTTVKARRDPDWEKRWLKDPQAVKPGTFMPRFPLPEVEIEAIVAYLYR